MGVLNELEIAAGGGATASIQKLKRAAASAAAFNPEDAATFSGATVTVNATHDAALTKAYTVAANQASFRFSGGKPTLNAATTQLTFPVSSIAPDTTGNLSAVLPSTPSYQAWGWEVEFQTESETVEIQVTGFTNHYFRLLVNGQYVDKTPTVFTQNNAANYIKLVFATRETRTIRYEGNVQDNFRGVAVLPTANIWPTYSADQITALCAGDSYSEGQGATQPGNQAWCKVMGRLLGWNDVRQVAVGGTGYINNAGTRSKIANQIPNWLTVNSDLTAASVNVITVAAGYNDYATSAATVAAEAAADVVAIRAAFPNALIFVFGVWAGVRGPDATTTAIETAILASVAAAGISNVYLIPVSTDAAPWTFGTGRVGAPNGSGNSDTDISTDGTHWSNQGHLNGGRRGANGIRSKLLALN